ncbi:hypothetical protein TvY486_0038570 [Trypanosoma vivax Y486]|uniref:Uncharacterized protein n=1 Tax=Trypanosoma vivax (strain Y486) TaxID=1055687 RepID=F9WTS2_TRYVY|nr:hypothetical protein TvY486_0038570 [Trypanosoma vivax Y486]|eukprot:CCD20967.1 hypothetical protein TvY486_0038570 [Trypanosoma vivax Y486]
MSLHRVFSMPFEFVCCGLSFVHSRCVLAAQLIVGQAQTSSLVAVAVLIVSTLDPTHSVVPYCELCMPALNFLLCIASTCACSFVRSVAVSPQPVTFAAAWLTLLTSAMQCVLLSPFAEKNAPSVAATARAKVVSRAAAVVTFACVSVSAFLVVVMAASRALSKASARPAHSAATRVASPCFCPASSPTSASAWVSRRKVIALFTASLTSPCVSSLVKLVENSNAANLRSVFARSHAAVTSVAASAFAVASAARRLYHTQTAVATRRRTPPTGRMSFSPSNAKLSVPPTSRTLPAGLAEHKRQAARKVLDCEKRSPMPAHRTHRPCTQSPTPAVAQGAARPYRVTPLSPSAAADVPTRCSCAGPVPNGRPVAPSLPPQPALRVTPVKKQRTAARHAPQRRRQRPPLTGRAAKAECSRRACFPLPLPRTRKCRTARASAPGGSAPGDEAVGRRTHAAPSAQRHAGIRPPRASSRHRSSAATAAAP